MNPPMTKASYSESRLDAVEPGPYKGYKPIGPPIIRNVRDTKTVPMVRGDYK